MPGSRPADAAAKSQSGCVLSSGPSSVSFVIPGICNHGRITCTHRSRECPGMTHNEGGDVDTKAYSLAIQMCPSLHSVCHAGVVTCRLGTSMAMQGEHQHITTNLVYTCRSSGKA